MRVLVSPGAEETASAGRLAAALAGPGGEVVPLTGVTVRTLRRRLSQAEVHSLRKALLGRGPGDRLEPLPAEASEVQRTVGFVCSGRAMRVTDSPALLAVADHANLTWRSPLTGPNDDRLGPRFAVVAGLYVPDAVLTRWQVFGGGAQRVGSGVVAEVADDESLTVFEHAVVERHGFPFASSELAGVAILAAHLGLRLAAGVIAR